MATTFIVIVSLIIVVCIALAVIVGVFMHMNNALASEEPEQADAAPTENTLMQNITGPLPPLMINPTQPLSEIYYHEGQTLAPEPLATQPPQSQPPNRAPTGPLPPGPPPTGPLPIFYNNQ